MQAMSMGAMTRILEVSREAKDKILAVRYKIAMQKQQVL